MGALPAKRFSDHGRHQVLGMDALISKVLDHGRH